MSCATICKISFKVTNAYFTVRWIWRNGTLQVHYTAPRRAAYLSFAKVQVGLVTLIQGAYVKTAVSSGYLTPRESDRLFGFLKPPYTEIKENRCVKR